MKVVAIVQARLGSTRFPAKVMKPIQGEPMIALLLERLSKAREVDQVVVATTRDPKDTPLADCVEALGYQCLRGSTEDVLDRYYQAAIATGADVIVRITGDCPLIDPELVDTVVARYKEGGVDYCSNVEPPTYPDGLDTEVFSFAALETVWGEAKEPAAREHVTPMLRKSDGFHRDVILHGVDLSHLRWTVDEPEDFEVVGKVFEHFAPDRHFSWKAVLGLLESTPEIFEANRHLIRNEGSAIGSGEKLWKRAKRVIPGGNMLLSKRAEMFLPGRWPAYFSRAKGCRVWDLDGREFIDMSIMGIGTNTLGYGHTEVDTAVRAVIDQGNMSTLNCPEEVYLAERLVALHPWADMVRLARTGGEANAVAIRIARAASGRDKVAICGYHGWHDWYLAANLAEDRNLDGHLLPGLEPNGVPRSLRGSVLPFAYNDFQGLQTLVEENAVGVIKMEVVRNLGPTDGFLEKVRELATRKGIVLIFDECTSGFRETFGGIHKKYGVEPDMAMFGKAMGNGYAITGVIGRREIMEAAQTTFISSTFWTERIGPVAALRTLEVMEHLSSWEVISATGRRIREGWVALARKHGLELDLWGIPALAGFTFKGPKALVYKTLVTQEMLAKGFLAGNCVYACTEHTPEVVEAYFEALDPVFGLIAECENGRKVEELLQVPVCHGGFKRLN